MPRAKANRFTDSELQTELTPEQMYSATQEMRAFMATPAWFAFCQKIEESRAKNDIRFIDPSDMKIGRNGKVKDPMAQYGICYGIQYAYDYVYEAIEQILTEGKDVRTKAE